MEGTQLLALNTPLAFTVLGLHLWDFVTLVVYLVVITGMGLWAARKVHTVRDFFMPRRFGKAMMIMHSFGTGTHSDQAVGVASKTFTNGLSGIWYQWLWLFCTPFYWLIAPFMKRFRAITCGDAFEARYDKGVAGLYAIVGMAQLTLNIGIMLKGSGEVIGASTGGMVSPHVAIAVMTTLFVIYGIAGGLSAAIVTDFLQGIMTILFSFLLLPFVLRAVDGISGLRAAIDAKMFSLVAPDEITAFYIVVIAFNALVVFAQWNVWLAVVAPVGAMLASFMAVSVYRQLTEERAKRHIRAMFAHAMSPALVDRLIEDPSVAKLGGERRVLSVYFSDLAGFTPISERLGEQQTVRLLNHYFDHMTEVIQNRSGGYLNKFLGDGIFVFFGAPVFQDDHARRAIQAAVESQQEVERLNSELAEEYAGDGVRLACRIGIATGEVMVGNCGSTDRLDYTAIGDTVNLASRLEGANKAFGTRIMVAESTWRDGGSDDLLARPLGKILVVGKQEPVSVWSLHGWRAEADDEALRDTEDFARGVEEFQRGHFEKAKGIFESILKRTPDDKAVSLYVETCRAYLASPPPDDWNGAIKLTEK